MTSYFPLPYCPFFNRVPKRNYLEIPEELTRWAIFFSVIGKILLELIQILHRV